MPGKRDRRICLGVKQALHGPMSPTERILLSQRLIEILSRTDPVECEQELRKLRRELDMK
ncbi:hypothetical protein CEXT_606761, partial [Caerostris extrusa]